MHFWLPAGFCLVSPIYQRTVCSQEGGYWFIQRNSKYAPALEALAPKLGYRSHIIDQVNPNKNARATSVARKRGLPINKLRKRDGLPALGGRM